ncbi:MAG: hypothetical protein ACRCZF_10825 [Gemmataceae bacterium]
MTTTRCIAIVACWMCNGAFYNHLLAQTLTREQAIAEFKKIDTEADRFANKSHRSETVSTTLTNGVISKIDDFILSSSGQNYLFANVPRLPDRNPDLKKIPFYVGKNSQYYFGILPTKINKEFSFVHASMKLEEIPKTSKQFHKMAAATVVAPRLFLNTISIPGFQGSPVDAYNSKDVNVTSCARDTANQILVLELSCTTQGNPVKAVYKYDLTKLGMPSYIQYTESSASESFKTTTVFHDRQIETGKSISTKGSTTVEKISNKGVIINTEVTNIESLTVFGDIPEYEFTLSAFGLPEPVGIEPIARPMNTLWYWLLGGAGFFAVVSVLLYRLKKRPEATA